MGVMQPTFLNGRKLHTKRNFVLLFFKMNLVSLGVLKSIPSIFARQLNNWLIYYDHFHNVTLYEIEINVNEIFGNMSTILIITVYIYTRY